MLFTGSQESERALCLHFSLIRTAQLRKLEPYQYYVEIMKAIPYCKKDEDYEALLPWTIDSHQSDQEGSIAYVFFELL